MTPKEKANELYDKMYDYSLFEEEAKRCALIAVDEILEVLKNNAVNPAAWIYFEEVKKEIENL